jgi:hypothetical protein
VGLVEEEEEEEEEEEKKKKKVSARVSNFTCQKERMEWWVGASCRC